MSTSEFDEYEPDLSDLFLCEEDVFPSDFSEADLAFAQELDSLFTLDKEELPPLFVQTLMQAEDPRLQSAEAWFEKRIQARVFRRLKLKRRLFRSPRLSLRAVVGTLTLPHSLLLAVTTAFLFILCTVFLTSTSFASGLGYLWAGAHSGVLQVRHYPTLSMPSSIASTQDEQSTPAELSMTEAQHLFHFPLSWPQDIPAAYTQSSIYFYPGNSNWADGPIAVLDFYTTAQPGQPPRHLYICEFKPQGIVLQVVQDGAAHDIKMDHETASAIYIQGQWTPNRSSPPIWDYSVGNQLIIEKSAVVFWIVGDKSGGVDENDLAVVGQSLTLLDQSRNSTYSGHTRGVTRSDDDLPWFLANEVIYQVNPDGSDGPSFRIVRALHPESHLSSVNTGQ